MLDALGVVDEIGSARSDVNDPTQSAGARQSKNRN